MATEVRIPKVGVSMTEGTLAEWYFDDGEVVESGQALYSLEMDKATNEVEAPATGRLTIHAQEGEAYPVGTLIATIT